MQETITQQNIEAAKENMATDTIKEQDKLTDETINEVDATLNSDTNHEAEQAAVPQINVDSLENEANATEVVITDFVADEVVSPEEAKEIDTKDEVTIGFEDFGLDNDLLSAIVDLGYKKPTPIQAKAIPEVLKGRDVLGIAQTGTGKTASFVLPMLEILSQGRAKARMPRTIILEPTRELAAQVAENFEKYGKNKKLNMALLIGGVAFGDQDALLMKGVDVLIATPGRLLDQFERGKILMSGVQMLVIDEADRMLDMGFIPDIERVAKLVPFTRQTLFFSATMPKEIEDLASQFLQAPVRVEVARPNQTAATIEQFVVKTPYNDAKQKRTILRNLINEEGDKVHNAIVFCNRKRDVDIVSKSLTKHGIPAAAIHGDLQQSQRMSVLEDFKSGKIKTLVASDVAARGIDVAEVSHVFNYDVPSHAEDYVHRIGRTGRAGRSGLAYMIVTPYDDKHLEAVEDLIKKKIDVVTFDVGQNNEPVKAFDRKRDFKKSDKTQNSFEDKKHHNKKYDDNKKNDFKRGEHKSSRNHHDYNEVIIGFGDNIPAFMLEAVVLDSAPLKEEVKKEVKKPTKKRARKAPIKTEVAKNDTSEVVIDAPVAQVEPLVEKVADVVAPVAEKPKRAPRKRVAKPKTAKAKDDSKQENTEFAVENADVEKKSPVKRARTRKAKKTEEVAAIASDTQVKIEPDVNTHEVASSDTQDKAD